MSYKLYSQMLLSYVSLPVFCKEQAAPDSSMLEHWDGSWKPHVWFKNLGWKKTVKPVFVPSARKEV